MSIKVREFVDFWIETSVHASETHGGQGGEQNAAVLASRCIEMAKSEGISDSAIQVEVGDLTSYIQSRLKAANLLESERVENVIDDGPQPDTAL